LAQEVWEKMSPKYIINKAKGFGQPQLVFLNDLTKKIQAGTIHKGKYIASEWLQSLSEQQFRILSRKLEKREASADIVATVLHLVCCEQEMKPTEFTEEDLAEYVHNFQLLVSLADLVNRKLVKWITFLPLVSQRILKPEFSNHINRT
jgi:hypothetical protein